MHPFIKREEGPHIRLASVLIFVCRAVVIIWVVFELAIHPEDIPYIRAETVYEVSDQDSKPKLTYSSLRNAERLDSFIREVLRTKGDTLSTVRQTTMDVTLAGYTIPKGERLGNRARAKELIY